MKNECLRLIEARCKLKPREVIITSTPESREMTRRVRRRDELEKAYVDLEMKFSKVLDYATGSCISKPHTDLSVIYNAIDRKVQKEVDHALKDFKECMQS